jgi:hypothetical protein
MTYAVDLTTLLKSLFEVRLKSDTEKTISWLELKEAYEAYEHSGSRQGIHRRICATFQQDQQTPDKELFQGMFIGLVKGEHPYSAGDGMKGGSMSAHFAGLGVPRPSSTAPPSPQHS